MTYWTEDDSDRWAEARAREVDTMTPAECRDMLRRLTGAMSTDPDRRDIWEAEHHASTVHH